MIRSYNPQAIEGDMFSAWLFKETVVHTFIHHLIMQDLMHR
jgi:hypothetical protein